MAVLGSWNRNEFRPALQALSRLVPLCFIPHASSTASLPFSVFLFCQSYPGQFSQHSFRQYAQAHPFVCRVLLLGSLCEGESRTGFPLQDGFRIYTHQWNEFHLRQFQFHFQGQPSLLTQPSTIKNEEIILLQSSLDSSFSLTHWKSDVYILLNFGPFGNDTHFNRLLIDMANQEHVRILSQKPGADFTGTLLADADDSPFPKILEAAQSLRHEFADADIEVCINSPRIDEKTGLLNVGVNRIWAKPLF